MVTRGDPELPERVFVGRFAAGLVASSYQAEVLTLREALVWLSECESAWESAVIVSDSLGARWKRLVIVWVAGHCGLVGNEWADVAAREAVLLDQVGVHCMFECLECVS